MLKTRPFDPCNYLHDPADVSAYLKVAAEEAAARHDLNSLLEAVATARRPNPEASASPCGKPAPH